MSLINKHISLLGHRAEDKISGMQGVISSVSFDLYGCVMALLSPGYDEKEGRMRDPFWLDVCRLDIKSKQPVIEQPDFVQGPQAEGRQGPAEKPTCTKA